MEEKEKVKKFEKEINFIKDSNVKKLLKACLKNANDWFFTEPASSSGKHHPTFALGAGGLVLHTKAVVYFLKEILRSEMYDVDEYHSDLLIFSAILHDIKKYGDKENVNHTVKNHPELASKYVEDVNKTLKNILPKKDITYIQRCIERHMGIFGDNKPETDDEKILHLSDLLASRREIDIIFTKEEKKNALPNVNEYVIDFGMYKGKLITEVPTDYLEWGAKNMDKKSVFKSLAKEILKERKNEGNK